MINPDNRMYRSQALHELENPLSAYSSLAQSCVQEATYHFALASGILPNEPCIEEALRELKAKDPVLAARQFEYHLSDAVGRKMAIQQAELFKAQFEKTGLITAQEIDTASVSIDKVFSGNGKFSNIPNTKCLLLLEILYKIEAIHPPEAQKSLAKKALSLFWMSPEATLSENKSQTLKWVQESINSPMLSTTEALWGENDEWTFPEPVELAMPLEMGGDFSDSDSEIELAPPRSLYPTLLKTNSLFAPLIQSQSLYPKLPEQETPIVTAPGTKHHLLVSYIDRAFADVFKNPRSDDSAWNALPGIVQKDALLHCIHLQSCSGAAEQLANRMFKTPDEFQLQLQFSRLKSSSVKTGLSEEFIRKGEELLQLYYADNGNQSRSDGFFEFHEKFVSLKEESLFLQYVYEMAVAAGIPIASWDHEFAKYNWKKFEMVKLGVQALERCLHTVPQAKGV